jgi:hypothetical protein
MEWPTGFPIMPRSCVDVEILGRFDTGTSEMPELFPKKIGLSKGKGKNPKCIVQIKRMLKIKAHKVKIMDPSPKLRDHLLTTGAGLR